MSALRDHLGNEIEVGSFIFWARVSGTSAYYVYARVMEIKQDKKGNDYLVVGAPGSKWNNKTNEYEPADIIKSTCKRVDLVCVMDPVICLEKMNNQLRYQ